MQLFEELNISDFKIYIDLVQNLFKSTLNLQMQDSDEIILIPLVSLLNEKNNRYFFIDPRSWLLQDSVSV